MNTVATMALKGKRLEPDTLGAMLAVIGTVIPVTAKEEAEVELAKQNEVVRAAQDEIAVAEKATSNEVEELKQQISAAQQRLARIRGARNFDINTATDRADEVAGLLELVA